MMFSEGRFIRVSGKRARREPAFSPLVARVGLAACAAAVLACTEPGALDMNNVVISAKASGLKVGDSLQITVTQGGTTVQQQTYTLGEDAISMSLPDGTYDFSAKLTPSGGSSVTHQGAANNVVVSSATAPVTVNIVLTPINKGVTVGVTLDDTAKAMPATVTGVHVDPSTKLYGGEAVTLTVQTTDSTLIFGWKAPAGVVVTAKGGPITELLMPTTLGTYEVRLFVHDGSGGTPSSMKVPLQVVQGGKATAEKRLAPTSAKQRSVDTVWTGSEYGVVWTDQRSGTSEIY